MVASILSPAEILAIPAKADSRRLTPLVRDFAFPVGGMRHLSATGAEIIANGIDESGMSFPAVISTADVDRVGDILIPEGCDLTGYRENSLVFLNHASDKIPIGVSQSPDGRLFVAIEPSRVLARCFCVQGGTYGQDAADIFHLIVQRAFNDVSVGFNPHPDPQFTQHLRTGGKRYDKWELLEWSVTGIGCNRAAKIIRKYLMDGRITGKTISPMLRKSLAPLAEPTPASVVSGFAPAHSPAPQSPTGEDMSKKWRKPLPPTRQKDAMTETNGTAGGYATPPGDDTHEKIKGEIASTMAEHGAEGHEAHYKAETGEVHHSHPDSADPDHLAAIKDGLSKIEGVKDVHQSPEAGPGEDSGYDKAFPPAAEVESPEKEKPTEEKPGEAVAAMEKQVKRLQADLAKMVAKMTAGLKAMDGNEYEQKDEDDLTAPAGQLDATDPLAAEGLPADEADERKKPGIEFLQAICELCETHMGVQENPQVVEFATEINDRAHELGAANYPDEDFGGNEIEDRDHAADKTQDREETQEAFDSYADVGKGWSAAKRKAFAAMPPAARKAILARERKSMEHLQEPEHADTIKACADHLHDMAGLEEKSFGMRHKRKSLGLARSMDRMHGVITHDMPGGGDDYEGKKAETPLEPDAHGEPEEKPEGEEVTKDDEMNEEPGTEDQGDMEEKSIDWDAFNKKFEAVIKRQERVVDGAKVVANGLGKAVRK